MSPAHATRRSRPPGERSTLAAVEASRSTDPARWRDAVLVEAEDKLLDAVDLLNDFPVLDGTVQRVVAIADDADTTTADLVACLEADPAFAANLLRYANSAAMARPIRAKTVRQAVMLVGRKALRRLALEAATYRFFEHAPGTGSARGEIHVHAISVASVAAAAADQVRAHGDGPHLGGLLHDIGKLVLPLAFGEEACDQIARLAPDGPERVVLERERLGIDHALAGALIAERWGVAPDVVAAIAWHHGGPTGIASPSPEVACVQVGDQVVRMVGGREPDHVLLQVALERAGLPAASLDGLAQHTLPASRPMPVGEGELARLITETDGLEQTDALTDVANRRHWLHVTRAALADAGGDRGAVLVCDVDGLAEVNRVHGEETGDVVLTELARILARHGRPGRLASDEFALWLHGGDAADAAASIADEVRVAFGDRQGPRVDVSIGLADAATHGTELSTVLEAAHLALRAAKDAGPGNTAAALAPAA